MTNLEVFAWVIVAVFVVELLGRLIILGEGEQPKTPTLGQKAAEAFLFVVFIVWGVLVLV